MFPLILAACGGSSAPPASADPASSTSASAAPVAALPSTSASAASTAKVVGDSDGSTVTFARLGATLRPPPGGAIKDGEKDAEIRGKDFVFKLHLEAERPKVLTATDARRQVMLREAAEFGLRGLVSGVGDPDEDSGPHENVEASAIAPREFVITDRAAQHGHVYVWRRRPAGGWIWAECRGPKDTLAQLRSACLTLAVLP